MTSKSLPASFAFDTWWKETHACCGLPFRKNFSLMMLDFTRVWFLLLWAEVTDPTLVATLQIFPQSPTGAGQHTFLSPVTPQYPRA